MSMDGQRANLIRDYDAEKRRKAADLRAKATTPKPPSNAQSAEIKRLRAKVANQETTLNKIRAVAVEMSKRSARMSNVPGYVLKNYADELIKNLNTK